MICVPKCSALLVECMWCMFNVSDIILTSQVDSCLLLGLTCCWDRYCGQYLVYLPIQVDNGIATEPLNDIELVSVFIQMKLMSFSRKLCGWQLVGGVGKGQHEVKMPNSVLLNNVSSGILLLCVFDCFIIISSSLKALSKERVLDWSIH